VRAGTSSLSSEIGTGCMSVRLASAVPAYGRSSVRRLGVTTFSALR
jgi:hypothetical protein